MNFEASGWQAFPPEPQVRDWIIHAHPQAVKAAHDKTLHKDWLRCGGTWFVGVDALPNDTLGRVGDGPPLSGAALEFVTNHEGLHPLHRAQISTIYPGYPQPMEGESPAALRFRRDRDAAHVDGLLPVGAGKRRFLREPHAYVLGIPLNACTAAPMVVWEGSHLIMREAFRTKFAGIPAIDWAQTDLTETYQTARRTCFETCTRREIAVPLGGAYAIHRLALHGVAPWKATDTAPREGRIIAYFRPQLSNIENWLS